MRARLATALLLLLLPALGGLGRAWASDRSFLSSDGVRLHYIERGRGPTIVLVPGWTMPAWIWQRQIEDFSHTYHVVAFDPRGQGASAIAPSGYEPGRRGQDIAELLTRLGGPPVLLVGWSLGVLDVLAYVHAHGDSRIAGLVLVDNSVGEDPPPAFHPALPGPRVPRPVKMRRFVRGMFATPQPQAWLNRLTAATLRLPKRDADALLAYPVPRTYWKDAVYGTSRPILYIVRQGFAGQAENLQAHRPNTETVVLHGVGHALFVDEPARFDALVRAFIRRHVWR
ncbi:MAG: alpha/beta hydrolase [Rhodospirillales bacterium]|nr:alpha/beta hydrolase [Rhodospirillales bacterium]MDE2576103.1 alpha/beta hydrolase [Rhodospirillales bacterium]